MMITQLPEMIIALFSAGAGGGCAALYAKWQSAANKEAIEKLSREISTVDDKCDTIGMVMADRYATKQDLRDYKDDFHRILTEVKDILVRMESKLDRKADKP